MVGLITGLMGAFSLFWLVFIYVRRQKRTWLERLSETVLQPWSKMKVQTEYDCADPLRLQFLIPKSVLPERVAAAVVRDALALERLPGLNRGWQFLKRERFEVWKEWQEVRSWQEKYEDVRMKVHEITRPLVRNDMARTYPEFRPVASYNLEPGTYNLQHITAKLEVAAHEKEVRERDPHVSLSKTSSGEIVTYELRNDSPLLKASKEAEAKQEEFEGMLRSWMLGPHLRDATAEMALYERELKKALARFRDSLEEVTLQIAFAEKAPK